MSIRIVSCAIVILMLSTSCASSVQGEITPTSTLAVASSPLPVMTTLFPSETMIVPSPQPTAALVDGVTSTQVNVRAEPSTASNILGIIPADMRVEITGKDPGGSWWQINYPQGVEGKGWVTAQYITTGDTSQIPIIGGAATDLNHANVAIVQQQINVRSGPGTDYNSLGTLNPQDVVSLTGKDPNGAWLQIEFAAGPEGKGWINAAFVQTQGAENLPIIAGSGLVIGTGTPTGVPATPTPTVVPAAQDGDSFSSPSASVNFEITGTQTFIYSGDLSSPQGDLEDWIAFMPYDQFVFVSLECQGSESIRMEIMENSFPLDTYIKCNDQMTRVAVIPDANYLVHLQSATAAEMLQYTHYSLTIRARP